ncbi:MAG: hypothetical protein WKG07_30730 [Hymenobacter sp.]
MLTVDDDSPIVLALQHTYVHEAEERDPILRTVKRAERTEHGAGSAGRLTATCPTSRSGWLPSIQRNVLRLSGERAAKIDSAYATKEDLRYTDLTQVLRMVEYYNQPEAKQLMPRRLAAIFGAGVLGAGCSETPTGFRSLSSGLAQPTLGCGNGGVPNPNGVPYSVAHPPARNRSGTPLGFARRRSAKPRVGCANPGLGYGTPLGFPIPNPEPLHQSA